jgi:hypothetical protein
MASMDISMRDEEERQALIGRLGDIQSSEELFLSCVKRAKIKLRRYSQADKEWLAKWIPILLRQEQ